MWKYSTVFIICFIFFCFCAYFVNDYSKLKKDYSIARNNIKVYEHLYDSTKNQNRQFQLTIDDLNYSKDSIIIELNNLRKKNKILDKKVKELSYVSSVLEIHDTLTLRDTTIIREGISIDTAFVSPWYNINFHLAYPDTLALGVIVPSEKYIIASTNRETINPPKKCFIGRLFQKKHTVVDVQVIEKNPYIKSNQSRFIEIVD